MNEQEQCKIFVKMVCHIRDAFFSLTKNQLILAAIFEISLVMCSPTSKL